MITWNGSFLLCNTCMRASNCYFAASNWSGAFASAWRLRRLLAPNARPRPGEPFARVRAVVLAAEGAPLPARRGRSLREGARRDAGPLPRRDEPRRGRTRPARVDRPDRGPERPPDQASAVDRQRPSAGPEDARCAHG